VLEVGNVLAHYHRVRHAVVDKYERADGVLNRDVVDLRPERDYDLIVSISTLEHVGFDEPGDPDPAKILRAVDVLTACLSPGGRMLVTLPLGCNPHLDRLLDEGGLGLTRRYCMRRMSPDNRWAQASWDEVRGIAYDRPYRCANALVIGVIDRAARG
jgi:cyclopropane fatty-acyl-phospholipid synthase-like methyltransferase